MSSSGAARLHCDEVALGTADLAEICAIEEAAYPFPWTPGNLRDSMEAGHRFHGLRAGAELCAYSILMPILDEAHLLNLTVAPGRQGHGWGRAMLAFSLRIAAVEMGAHSMLLEVRPSNGIALALYASMGFKQVGRRRNYYPASVGREDALVLRRSLP